MGVRWLLFSFPLPARKLRALLAAAALQSTRSWDTGTKTEEGGRQEMALFAGQTDEMFCLPEGLDRNTGVY